MTLLNELINNEVFVPAISSWFLAQVIKTIIHLCVSKRWVWERMVGSGGMPSCHSATVCALTTAIFINYGIGSTEFAISSIFSVVVMYDAMGVRRETGIQAKVINEMMELVERFGSDLNTEEKLKEFVGHTPFQVFIGAVLGIVVSIIYCLFIQK